MAGGGCGCQAAQAVPPSASVPASPIPQSPAAPQAPATPPIPPAPAPPSRVVPSPTILPITVAGLAARIPDFPNPAQLNIDAMLELGENAVAMVRRMVPSATEEHHEKHEEERRENE